MGLKKQRGTRPGGDARHKQVGGGKLLLPEEGVTQGNLHKWEQQNRYIYIYMLIVRSCLNQNVFAGEHIMSLIIH